MTAGVETGSPAQPPLPFRLTSAQVVELREGGGGLMLIGLPFLVGGCVIAYTILRAWNTGAGVPGAGVGFAFSILSLIATTGLAAVLVFGRRWTVMDLSRGLLVRSYGLLVPLKTQEQPLREFNAVVIAFDMGDSGSPENYPVRLRANAGCDFVVRKPQKFGDSRLLAEYLSEFLRLPLIDTISDHETVAAPGHAWRNLRDPRQRAEMSQPERPANMRSEITEDGVNLTIVIPGGGGLPVHILGIVLPLTVLLVVMPRLGRALSQAPTLPSVRTAIFILLAILVIPPLLFVSAMLMVRGSRKRTTVVASPTGLEIERRSGLRSYKKQVAAADLLDVDTSTIEGAIQSIRAASTGMNAAQIPDSVWWIRSLKKWVPTKGIVVKSRTEVINFGEGLSTDELQYLTWVLRKALAASNE